MDVAVHTTMAHALTTRSATISIIAPSALVDFRVQTPGTLTEQTVAAVSNALREAVTITIAILRTGYPVHISRTLLAQSGVSCTAWSMDIYPLSPTRLFLALTVEVSVTSLHQVPVLLQSTFARHLRPRQVQSIRCSTAQCRCSLQMWRCTFNTTWEPRPML